MMSGGCVGVVDGLVLSQDDASDAMGSVRSTLTMMESFVTFVVLAELPFPKHPIRSSAPFSLLPCQE